MSPRETLLWTVVAAVTFVGLAAYFGEVDNNDGYQYVSIAENIRSTGHISTSLVHFDTEREHATIPAPETTFPPGYSAFISLVSILGPGPDFAAEIVSVLGAILVALFLCKLCLVIGCSVNAARFAVILWLANSYALAFSRTVASESLFAATITAAILLLLVSDQTLRRDEAVPRTLTWAFILAGLSAWIRYAGYFIFCGFLLYALVLLLMKVSRKIVVLQSLLAGGSLITALLVRNFLLTSTWRGGNTIPFSNPIAEIARNGVGALTKLVFGDYARADLRVPVIGLCAVIVLVAVALIRTNGRFPLSRPVFLLTGLICVYSALMFYAGLHTPINFGARMFFPILPLILAVLGWFFSWTVESLSPPRFANDNWLL